jgi:hypothetical protein
MNPLAASPSGDSLSVEFQASEATPGGDNPHFLLQFNFLAIQCIGARVAAISSGFSTTAASICFLKLRILHRKLCGTATLFVAQARLAPSEEGNFRSRHSHIAKVELA